MKKTILLIITFIIFITNINNVYCEETNLVNIYIFHSDNCEHCKEEIKLLNDLKEKYNNIKIYKYEINNEKNKKLFDEVTDIYNTNSNGVPFTVIGDKYFIGYNLEKTPSIFIKTIIYYSKYGYLDKVAPIVGNDDIPSLNVEKSQITYDEFIETYANYRVLFFNTKNLNLESTNILTSILTEINIFNIIMVTIISIIINKIKNNKDKFIISTIYIGIYIITSIFYNLKIEIINNAILLIAINYFSYSVLFYMIKNNKIHVIYSISAIIAAISNYLKINYHHKYMDIYNEILNLNYLNKIEYTSQIITNVVIKFFTVIILLYISCKIVDKIQKVAKK